MIPFQRGSDTESSQTDKTQTDSVNQGKKKSKVQALAWYVEDPSNPRTSFKGNLVN